MPRIFILSAVQPEQCRVFLSIFFTSKLISFPSNKKEQAQRMLTRKETDLSRTAMAPDLA
jgi:hypothetical protein